VGVFSTDAGAAIPDRTVRHRFGREDAVRWALVAGFSAILYLFILLPMAKII